MALFNGSGLGWTFDAELDDTTGGPPDGGLVLKNIRHDGHNFAHDIRIIGVWINSEEIDSSGKRLVINEPVLIILDSKSFKPSSVKTLKPETVTRTFHIRGGYPAWRFPDTTMTRTFDYLQEVDTALSFSDYFKTPGGNYVAYGLAVEYDAPNLFADRNFRNCEYAGLSIEQNFLFARYSNQPPHEPSGALSAARFHPLVSYKLSPNSACDRNKTYTRIVSLRFDFRLYLYLDTYLKDKTESGLWNDNQAGLFADRDIGSFRVAAKGIGYLDASLLTGDPGLLLVSLFLTFYSTLLRSHWFAK
jgi:hypothetical protein